MLREICKATGVTETEYRKTFGIKGHHPNRLITRTMILDYWKSRGAITSSDWLFHLTIEAMRKYKRETGKCPVCNSRETRV